LFRSASLSILGSLTAVPSLIVDNTEKRILLAASGGPDSTALLHLAAQWRVQNPFLFFEAATIDHGLRASSRQEAQHVAEQAHALGISHTILTWEADKPQTGIQEAARIARYKLLMDHAAHINAKYIATAHHLDDQAETFLLRLCHGSGLKGLAGMRPSSSLGAVTLLRPLLHCSKTELVQLCDKEGWSYIKDPSNSDLLFARARLRAITPLLQEEGLTSKRLALTASRLARADEALDDMADRVFQKAVIPSLKTELVLDFSKMLDEPVEIILRVFALAVREAASHPGSPLSLERLERLVKEMMEAPLALTRTLGGVVIFKSKKNLVRFKPESPRIRGASFRIKH
jgi:tRNA(Ile)-lysidine synthase